MAGGAGTPNAHIVIQQPGRLLAGGPHRLWSATNLRRRGEAPDGLIASWRGSGPCC